jgi:predicted Zn-dependent protease
MRIRLRIRLSPTKYWAVVLCALTCIPAVLAGAQSTRTPVQPPHDADGDVQVVSELQIGISLTSQSKFQEAIPHLLAAKLQGDHSFAGQFDLALCYVATAQYHTAIEILKGLEAQNPRNANVYSLLAQAYVLTNQIPDAIESLKSSAALAPKNEKLYLLVGDACMERGQYAVGLDVANLGLKHLPESVGLLYQRGMFLTLLDQFDTGKLDLERAAKIGRGSEIAFLAAAQKASFEGNMAEVVRVSREGSRKYQNAALLTMLGEALIRSGVMPGQSEFEEAVAALEKSVAMLPENPPSRIALGKLYLMESRSQYAIVQLETARQLDSDNTAVYSNLAKAYRQVGDQAKAQSMLLRLSELNQEQAENIRSAPGERKSSYLGSRSSQSQYSSKPVSKEPTKQP